MSSIVDIYTHEVYENLKPLYANWEPGKPVQLGDYGVLRDRIFIHLGNIRDMGITFTIRKDDTRDHKFFASKGTTEIKFHAKGTYNINGVVSVKPAVEISFKKEEAMFFNAADCAFSMIKDKSALGRAVLSKYDKGKWERAWVVVTDIVKSGATTIAISAAESATLILEATGNVERIDLADASTKLAVRYTMNVGYQVISQSGLIPLIGLSQIQSKFIWFGKEFKPLMRAMAHPAIRKAIEETKQIQTEENAEDIYFGQLK